MEEKLKKKKYFLDFRSDPLFLESDPSPDPYQNETDSKHCFQG